MFAFCHPEDAAFASEGSGRAARTFARSLSKCKTARLARNLKNSYKGGKNGTKLGQTRAIRAVCRAFGSVFHRLLVFSSKLRTALTVLTTSYHFVPHLSRKSFIVKQKLDGPCPTPALILENTEACG